CSALNTGGFPPGYFALIEQAMRGRIPDFLDWDLSPGPEEPAGRTSHGLTVADVPPGARVVRCAEEWDERVYARKADRITVRDRYGRVVAVVEILSPATRRAPARRARSSRSPRI